MGLVERWFGKKGEEKDLPKGLPGIEGAKPRIAMPSTEEGKEAVAEALGITKHPKKEDVESVDVDLDDLK